MSNKETDQNWENRNALVLAYMGDAVYELWVRRHLLEQGYGKVEELHRLTVSYVQAKSQAIVIRAFQQELTETEKAVFLRGRNAKSHCPKSVDVVTYRHATAFEALVGYWYLSGQTERMIEMLNKIDEIKGSAEKGME